MAQNPPDGCLVPRCRMQPAVVTANHRRVQPVGIFVQLLQRRALGAGEPVAEDVIAITPDATDAAVVFDFDLEAARGLAQRARPKNELTHAGNFRAIS